MSPKLQSKPLQDLTQVKFLLLNQRHKYTLSSLVNLIFDSPFFTLSQFLKEYFSQRTESTLDRSMSLRSSWEQSWILKPGEKMVARKKSFSESWGDVVTSESDGRFGFWEESAGSSISLYEYCTATGQYCSSRVPQEDGFHEEFLEWANDMPPGGFLTSHIREFTGISTSESMSNLPNQERRWIWLMPLVVQSTSYCSQNFCKYPFLKNNRNTFLL